MRIMRSGQNIFFLCFYGTEGVCSVPQEDLRSRAPIKVVTSGVALEVNAKDIREELDEAVWIKRLTRIVGGVPKPTPPILLFFDEESLPILYLGYMRFPVRAFMPKPMQCYKCTLFGHVSSVCRQGVLYAS